MYEGLQSRLSVTSSSTFYTLTRVKSAINDAYIWAGGLFLWPATRKAKTTSTQEDQYYYDYPVGFKTDSVFRIDIDGQEYDPKSFEDFLDYRRDNPTSTKRIFASYGKQYFIFPTPTADGSNNLDVWGHEAVTTLSADGDKTIFSDSEPEGNEAIVKQALAVLQAKGKDKKLGQVEDAEAKQILAAIYSKQLAQQQKYQRLDHPKFEVPNYFSGAIVQSIGRFNVETD